MAKYVCQVCGYVYEGDAAPAECPICHAPASKFTKQEEGKTWAAEHVVGVAKGAPEDIIADLRANFQGECSEVGQWSYAENGGHDGYSHTDTGTEFLRRCHQQAAGTEGMQDLRGLRRHGKVLPGRKDNHDR